MLRNRVLAQNFDFFYCNSMKQRDKRDQNPQMSLHKKKALKKDNLTGDIRKLGKKLAKNQLPKQEELYMFQHLINNDNIENSVEVPVKENLIVEAAISGQKDNSRKAYYREFRKVVDQADVILQVLDARDPLGCRSKDVEEMIMNAGAGKKIILVLNKIGILFLI